MAGYQKRESSKIKKIKRMSTEKKYPVMVFSFKKYLNKKINADKNDNFIANMRQNLCPERLYKNIY